MHNRIDRERDQEEARIKMHNRIDKARDQTEKRIEMHRLIDQDRDITETRIEMHRRLADERRRIQERKVYENGPYINRYLKSIDLDTGFNVICLSCAEYKSTYACTGVQVLSNAQQKKYLINNNKNLISKNGKSYICKSCRSQIDANKFPKKSEKHHQKFSGFPNAFKRKLKQVTNYSKVLEKRKLANNKENINQVLELNKLEAHLLKLVIPFVRIAHCQRGSYFKVKGNLILISANVSQSLSKILPLNQDILPVCFKRKLEYKGNYLEEIIDKDKVNQYFSFYKEYNPLYENIELQEDRIDQFETESLNVAKSFEENAIKPTEDSISDDEDSTSESDEDCLDEYDFSLGPEEDAKVDEQTFFRDQSTVFCNKYEEDVGVPTVANKLANIIVNVEILNKIDYEDYEAENLDINDEINLEEVKEFWDDINIEVVDQNKHFQEYKEVEDEFCQNVEDRQNEKDIKKTSKNQRIIYSETLRRMEKISVAPGEKGKFQNWGDDVFLEEKCFPELFPFGIGGYLSQTATNEGDPLGFAAYVKHRVLSAEPKYRNNSSYIFFLLLVKELIQLKRCRQTYMRQATKAPNLTKETLLNVKPQDLSRYNRSYEVFKTMRGTSMYFEEAKKNVMATLRQNGSPSLFVTLSCAEYSWKGLLKEILEASKGREVTEEELDNLTSQQRNKLISENVVQSTLHFQKRIEKELKLMTFSKFFDDKCSFSVISYFYRIEFQQRGAPHVHCLVWLKDDEGNPAPTFWASEDDDINKEMKIKKIEEIADQLITASIDSAICDEHKKELENLNQDRDTSEVCSVCYTAKYDFMECPKHQLYRVDSDSCPDCIDLKELAKKCQTHNHTFTCKKRRKKVTVRGREGHGRMDGKIEGTRMSNYIECRFNFPQFPLNRTVFVLGLSKDLSEEEVNQRKTDLKKIKKFLIRQTHTENNEEDQ